MRYLISCLFKKVANTLSVFLAENTALVGYCVRHSNHRAGDEACGRSTRRFVLLFGLFVATVVGVFPLYGGKADSNKQDKTNRPELVLQRGHGLGIYSAAFAPDGSWIATAGADKTIGIWQTSSGHQLRQLAGLRTYVKSLAISHDGRLIAAGTNDHTISIWDVGSGEELASLTGHTGPILSIAFSPDGRWLTSGSADKAIKIWDLNNQKEVKSLVKHTGSVVTLVFSDSGSLLASAAGREVITWDTATWLNRQTFRRNTADVMSLAISSDGNLMASSTKDGNVVVWLTNTDREKFVFKQNSSPALMCKFFPDGSLVALHADGSIHSWDTKTGNKQRSIRGDSNQPELIVATFSKDGQWFAASVGNTILSLHRTSSGEITHRLQSHSTAVNSLVFSSDGRWFASANNDSSVRLWQVATGRELPRLRGHAGYSTTVSFSPDGQLLASGGVSGEVRLWDVNTTQDANIVSERGKSVNGVSFSGDSKLLAVARNDQNIELWDLEKKVVTYLSGHLKEVTTVAFSTKRNLLVSAGRDKTIRLWDPITSQSVATFEGPAEINGLDLSPDGQSLATANSDNTVSLWDLASGKLARTLSAHTSEVLSVRFSPDGHRLASASSDHTIALWDLQSPGSSPTKLLGNTDGVQSVAFTMNGRFVLSGGADGSILLWDASTTQRLATLVSIPDSDDWLVATPDGLFDGSPESWDRMLWRFDQSTFSVVPVEAYFNEFYYPGVLAEILSDQNPKAIENIAQKDRRQPQIALKATSEANPRNVTLEIAVIPAPADKNYAQNSGAKDLRLFRNGLLIRLWTGGVGGNGGVNSIQATVPIVAGENRFTAYVFNNDNVKSSNASLLVEGSERLRRQGTAYLLMVGVEQYENPEYNLRYAATDVLEMEAQLKAQQEKLGKYNPIVPVPLLNSEATKANILLALKRLSGTNTEALSPSAPTVLARIKPAQPEDAVLVYFSGHGVSANDHFYLVPHDLGYQGRRSELNANGLQEILSHAISDDEVESALRPLDADQLLLVIDSCYSGQAIESTEKRRGPMNTKGLAQLAYEKGMYVLTASQNIEVAFEAEAFKHSYLAFALLNEGLKEGLADANRDGNIFLREWFDYANKRVPQLRKLRLKRKELVEEEADEQKVQRPRVFYSREEGAKKFLIGRVTTN